MRKSSCAVNRFPSTTRTNKSTGSAEEPPTVVPGMGPLKKKPGKEKRWSRRLIELHNQRGRRKGGILLVFCSFGFRGTTKKESVAFPKEFQTLSALSLWLLPSSGYQLIGMPLEEGEGTEWEADLLFMQQRQKRTTESVSFFPPSPPMEPSPGDDGRGEKYEAQRDCPCATD